MRLEDILRDPTFSEDLEDAEHLVEEPVGTRRKRRPHRPDASKEAPTPQTKRPGAP